jgi:hypothetical protein
MTASGNYSDPSDWLLRTIRKNPEGLLLLGAGVALLLRGTGRAQPMTSARRQPGGEGPYGPYGMSGTTESAARTASAAGAGEQLRSASEKAAERVSQVQQQAQEAVNSALDSGQKAVDAALQSGQSAMNSALQSGQNMVASIGANPLLVSLLGIGTGLTLASLLPETEIEHRAFGDAGKNLAQTAKEAGSRIASATEQAADKLAEAASQRGLDKEGVQSVVGEVSETFSTALRADPQDGNQQRTAPDERVAGKQVS